MEPVDHCAEGNDVNPLLSWKPWRGLRPRHGPAPSEPQPPENVRLLRAYAEKSRAAGLHNLVLYLSFDCDTDADATAALELDPWLRERGIHASYAVPGAQLRRASDAYKRLKSAGATFMNHGSRPHAEWREDRYVPITFYDQMAPQDVVSDIRQGHHAVLEVTGEVPAGFRAPHFGSFQAPDQLALVYETARELGYSYCTTTIPKFALDEGPVIDRAGVCEIPLFGSFAAPTTILDSWTYLEDRKDYRLGQAYFDLFRETVDYMLGNDLPGVLAYYADPAHVIGSAVFKSAMDLTLERGIESVTAEELVAQHRRQQSAQNAPSVTG